jgi:hypothetical protein
MLEHRPGRARQLAPGLVPPVKRQVDGTEEVSEPLGPCPFIGHATRIPASESIVNPDGSAQAPRDSVCLSSVTALRAGHSFVTALRAGHSFVTALRAGHSFLLAGCGTDAACLGLSGEAIPVAGHSRRGCRGR